MESLWSGSIDEWTEPTPTQPRRGRVRGRGHAAASGNEGPAGRDPRGDDPSPPVEPLLRPRARSLRTMEVEVVRSAKRRKSVSARIVDGRIVVRMPQWMTRAQEAEYVTDLVAKLERQQVAEEVDLDQRARELAKRYDLPRPKSIQWVTNQKQRWGSCTPSTGEIRISDRIAGFPGWVLDGVIVHELAHLVHLHHSAEFWELAHRYPKTERAYGFLIAKHMGDELGD
ncbi:MAG: M48 family metallopeptidase [Actinomycetota bacterium]